MGDYQQAYDTYMKANQTESATPEGYYWAAQAKANIVGSNISDIIALLDSAVAKTGTPPTAAAAPYLLERIDYKLQLNNFIGAVADYDLYYNLMNGQVADAFFYYREQAKFRLGELDGALADIQEAIRLNPNSAIYYAEEASVFIRMEKYNEALASIEKALKLEPDFAASYRLQGVCYIRLKKKAEACQSFNKAKELGDPVVDRLIKEHCK